MFAHCLMLVLLCFVCLHNGVIDQRHTKLASNFRPRERTDEKTIVLGILSFDHALTQASWEENLLRSLDCWKINIIHPVECIAQQPT